MRTLFLSAIALSLSILPVAVAQDTAIPGERPRLYSDPIVQFSEEQKAEWDGEFTIEWPETYELASIILTLTPYGNERTEKETEYYQRVENHFSAFAGHPAVAAAGANHDVLFPDALDLYDLRNNAYVFCFDDENDNPDRLRHCRPMSHTNASIANNFSSNLALIEDFARVSGFRDFYAENRDYYEAKITEFGEYVDPATMKTWLEARFPNRINSYRVVFSSLTAGWHNTSRFTDDDFIMIIMFIEPIFEVNENTDWVYSRIVFTEIDHNYVNPVSYAYSDRMNTPKSFADGEDDFWADREILQDSYSSGYQVFNEYMTFAVFELYARDYFPDRFDFIKERLDVQMAERRGFPHYRAFADELTRLYDAAAAASDGPVQIADLYPPLLDWAESYRARN